MTKTVTNEQIDSLLHALDHEPVMARDYMTVRRWLEMIADEPTDNPCPHCGPDGPLGNL